MKKRLSEKRKIKKMTRDFLFSEGVCTTLLFFVVTDAWAVRVTSFALLCLVICIIGWVYGHPTLIVPMLGYNLVFAVMVDTACIMSAIAILYSYVNGQMARIGEPMKVFVFFVLLVVFPVYAHFNEWLLRQAYHLLKTETQIRARPETMISKLEENDLKDVKIDRCEIVNVVVEKSSKVH